MKIKLNTIYFLALLIIGASCTKVIDVDLNESAPQIVVDAYVKYDPINNHQRAVVNLSRTASYFDNNVPEVITNANLKMTNGNNKEYPLNYNINIGFYADIIEADFSNKWTLEGSIENSEVIAVTTIPNFIKIDSINAYKLEFGPPKEGYTPVAFFTDLPGESNYYRLKIWVNNIEYNDLFYSRDDGQDGEQIAYPFFKVEAFNGDNVKIELLCIDEFSFEYYKVFGDNMGGGGFSAAPGNPYTNIEGEDMLGVFIGQTSNVVIRTVGN